MRTILFALSVVTAAACSHDAAPPPQTPQPTDPVVANDYDIQNMPTDPTLPSWAPRSCSAYHTAVVQLAECHDVSVQARDTVKTQYDVDHARWQAMHDEPPEHMQTVEVDCRTNYQNVTAQNSCLAQNQPRPQIR